MRFVPIVFGDGVIIRYNVTLIDVEVGYKLTIKIQYKPFSIIMLAVKVT